MSSSDDGHLTSETRGTVRLLGLRREKKRNAFDEPLLLELAAALGAADRDPGVRCTLLFGHGTHFTSGLDLLSLAPRLASGSFAFPEGSIDPQAVARPRRSKPLVTAIRGACFTIGLDLVLASDVVIAGDDVRIAALEVKRGIYPSGGATVRFTRAAGWSDAMRYMLTGDELGAREALRMRLVSEVVPADAVLERALQIATTIAEAAPLGVRAVLASANEARSEGDEIALDRLFARLQELLGTDDAREGYAAALEKRAPRFLGR